MSVVEILCNRFEKDRARELFWKAERRRFRTELLIELVEDGSLTKEKAAQKLDLTVSGFEKAMLDYSAEAAPIT